MAFEPAATTPEDRAAIGDRAGSCTFCAHLQVLRSRTSVFVRCGRADDDPELPRYPILPVGACHGFEPAP